MTPGPTLIMKVPGCNKPVKIATDGSGNTFGATFWTDGKCEAPCLSDEPWLRKSPAEGVLFWSDECEEIGQISYFDDEPPNPDWKDLEYAEDPLEEDYIVALNSGVADTNEKMRYVRMRLWWLGNDRIRQSEASTLSDLHLQNLEAFAAILSEDDPDQRLMKAEALRELSRFGEALTLLTGSLPDEAQDAVEFIKKLAEAQNCSVAALP